MGEADLASSMRALLQNWGESRQREGHVERLHAQMEAARKINAELRDTIQDALQQLREQRQAAPAAAQPLPPRPLPPSGSGQHPLAVMPAAPAAVGAAVAAQAPMGTPLPATPRDKPSAAEAAASSTSEDEPDEEAQPPELQERKRRHTRVTKKIFGKKDSAIKKRKK